MSDEQKLKDALLKKALGFESDEVVEEYALDENGNAKLSKRKVTKKFNPPDATALKFLLEGAFQFDDEISKLTDSELEAEKTRLLQLLKEKEKENENANLQKSTEM